METALIIVIVTFPLLVATLVIYFVMRTRKEVQHTMKEKEETIQRKNSTIELMAELIDEKDEVLNMYRK